MNVAYLLAGLVLGVVLGVAGAALFALRARAQAAADARAKTEKKLAELGTRIAPPGVVNILDNVRKTVAHVLSDDERAKPLASFLNVALVEAYGQGASDFRAAVIAQQALPDAVMDGVCSSAMEAVATGAASVTTPPWPAWADDA